MEKENKKVTLGMFWGKELFIETRRSDKFDYAKAFDAYLESIKKSAVEQSFQRENRL